MYFQIVGEISEIETIATSSGIRELQRLRKRYGRELVEALLKPDLFVSRVNSYLLNSFSRSTQMSSSTRPLGTLAKLTTASQVLLKVSGSLKV